MNPTEWQQIKVIVHEALETDPEQRANFVAQRCSPGSPVSDEVIALLNAEQTLGDFISEPAYLQFVSPGFNYDVAELKIGERFGRYEIVGELGRGGMGAVYLAHDDELKRQVALKIIPGYPGPGAAGRFLREARTISTLNHPNVLTIHEIGRVDSTDFIATEFVDGVTLRQRIGVGSMAINQAAEIGAQVLAALAAAHAAGFIHRDIKPENIIIRRDGLVKVLDFGIAKLTAPQDSTLQPVPSGGTSLSTGAGTPRYMSPEQLRGEALDQRTDVWSFGAVLFEILTGRAPANDYVEVLAWWNDPASSPETHEKIRCLIKKCLAPARDERYHSADAVLTDLRNIAKGVATGSDAPTPSLGSVKFKYAAVAAAFLLAIVSGMFLYVGPFGGRGAALPEIRNLAVLPVESVGSSADEDYFTDGLTEGLISDLSHIADLRVISRTSVMRYKDKRRALPEIARELNVEAVLTSTVQRSGSIIRLSVKLIHAPTGRPIWEGGYERSQSDLPALQKEIARDIARVISIKLTPGEDVLLSNSEPVDPKAYEEYLRGRFFLNKRNEDALKAAISHFEASIARDPQFALSYAFLADAYFALGTEIVSALPPAEALEKGGIAAARAVELDSSLAEAHTSLGVIKLYTWQWADAEASLKRAIELNPNYAAAHSWYALYFASQGRVGEAIARMYRARDLDPVSPHITQNVGWMLHYAGQYQEEIEQYERALELDPDFLFAHRRLAGAYRQLGRFDASVAECEKVIAASGRKSMSLLPLANVYARAGRKADAKRLLRELLAQKNGSHVSSYALASLYAALGDKHTAFDLLKKAYDEKSYAMVFLQVTKDFDESFRQDPRFVNLLRQLDLESDLP